MKPIEKLPTGVPGLDAITHGGIPRGRTTLIAGKSGTAKSILALQIATQLARNDVKTALFAVEETPDDLTTTGDSLGFDVGTLRAHEKLIISDLTQPLEGPIVVAGEYDLAGLVHRIERAVKEHGVRAVILDSATALFSPRPAEALMRAHFLQLVSAFRRLDVSAIVTAEAPADYGPLTTLGVEDFLCDAVVVLRNLVDGTRRRRSIEVHKYRRSAHYKGEYPCTITARGLVVFPLDAEDSQLAPENTRFSSGVGGLDDMNNGGWLRDSIVLVRGPSGCGKTTLAGMYARAGAERGERVVYYGFEETKPMLMRNFAQMGMPLEQLEKQGALRVVCRYPESTSPEDLLVDLRLGLDQFRPSLIVIDSVSSIEHSTSQASFRQFLVGVAALLRQHGRSALLTQTTGTFDDFDRDAPFLSTIPDAICMMDYTWAETDMERTIRILKMRGSSHATEKRQLRIGPHGLVIEKMKAKQR